jgi:tRNA-uridine 2-sulfurtransferase
MQVFKPKKGVRVVVALSGGVDSSVSAYLLKKLGFEVIGLFMKNWEEDTSDCPALQDYEDVVQVCQKLEIPYYSVNFSKEYWDTVFSYCLSQYQAGYTPNPDVLCNREIKFKTLFNKAIDLGAEYLATGHYCQHFIEQEKHFLAKGLDPSKDQSYFLHSISPKALKYTLFPIGGMEKKEVKKIAKEQGLVTANKKESMGICFIGKRKFKPFLENYLTCQKGEFRTLDEKVLGTHDGVAFYTIGQRKGLGVGGPGDAWYVARKEIPTNTIYLVQGENHPALFQKEIQADNLEWFQNDPPSLPLSCYAKIRYRQEESLCTLVSIKDSILTVEFKKPQRAVTPKQSIVFYSGDICLGGGTLL